MNSYKSKIYNILSIKYLINSPNNLNPRIIFIYNIPNSNLHNM